MKENKPATCHPSRWARAYGLCYSCYDWKLASWRAGDKKGKAYASAAQIRAARPQPPTA